MAPLQARCISCWGLVQFIQHRGRYAKVIGRILFFHTPQPSWHTLQCHNNTDILHHTHLYVPKYVMYDPSRLRIRPFWFLIRDTTFTLHRPGYLCWVQHMYSIYGTVYIIYSTMYTLHTTRQLGHAYPMTFDVNEISICTLCENLPWIHGVFRWTLCRYLAPSGCWILKRLLD